MKPTNRLISLACGLATVASLNAADITVFPGESLLMAVRQAREMKRLGQAESVTIKLNPGVYRLTDPLTLLPEDSHLTIEGDGAVLSGAQPLSGWRQEGRFWVAEAPVVNGNRVAIRQLWVNGNKALRATQFGQYKLNRLKGFDLSSHTITIPTPCNFEALQQAPALEMLVHQRWAIAILRVKTMRQQGENTIVTFQEPESYLEFSHPWPQPIIDGERGSSSFCLMNALSLVDEPGEWYQDKATGKIYYLPRKDENIATLDAEAPVLERLLNINGAPGLRISDITLRGLTFSHSAWTRPSRLGHVTLQGGFPLVEAYKLQKEGLPWCDRLENQAWIERPDAAVSVSWGTNINIEGCKFTHLAATGLDFAYADKNVSATHCIFNDIGGTALMAGSFAEGATEVHRPYVVSADQEEYCDTLLISNNSISDASNEDWGAVGIGCGYVRNASITDNEVKWVNYSGICVGWGWTPLDTGMRSNRISRNKVSYYARILYDAGGIYTLSYQPNSFIIDNIVSEPAQSSYATNYRAFKLYLDDSSDGFTIKGNNINKNEIGTNHPGTHIHYETN